MCAQMNCVHSCRASPSYKLCAILNKDTRNLYGCMQFITQETVKRMHHFIEMHITLLIFYNGITHS